MIRYTVRKADKMGLALHCKEEAICDCGKITGERCQWSGDASELVEIEYMPEHLRASHKAAGNRGTYPHNGAVRLSVSRECADLLVDGDWCTEIR